MRALCCALAILAAAPVARAGLPPCGSQRWVGAWGASPSDSAHDGFADQTLREIITPHIGGQTLRLHLTNRFGRAPVTFDEVTVAKRKAGAALVPGSVHPVTFGGKHAVTIEPGADAVSDPVALAVDPFQDLAVSFYTSGPTGAATEHFIARQTSYVSDDGSGDHSADESGDAYDNQLTSWFFLDGVDVMATAATGAVAAFGDSITDGFEGDLLPVVERREGFDQNARYPDFLARRLLGAQAPLSVLNDGISGNRLLSDGLIPQFGPRALSRLDADVLRQQGVTTAIVLLGINDLGQAWPPGSVTAAQLTDGYRQLIARMHAAGVRVLMATMTPAGRTAIGGYGSDQANTIREQANAWIRSSGAADGVVDFDAALRDPADPSRLAAQYDSGDHLHPNLAGYKRMADTVDLGALARPACAEPARSPVRRHRHRHRRRHRRR